MAQDNQDEFSLPVGLETQISRKTARHLPNYFRTDPNKKFLGGTLDPLTQPGKLTRINSYIGRRDIPNYTFDDNYQEEINNARQYYQLESSFVYDDAVSGKVKWYADYIDYINTLKYFGAPIANHGKLNKSESYAWDPNINWDKFVNYREYYWLPNGPDPITIYGETESITSTFSVTGRVDNDNTVYVFSPDGLTANPRITLYRGQTYKFNITAKGYPFAIKTRPETGISYFYNVGVNKQLIEEGVLEFTVPYEAPSVLYYLNNKDPNSVGVIEVKDIKDATFLDINLSIIGKNTFTSANGIEFINGLKINFSGKIFPEIYSTGHWYVEGVGDKIKLINADTLATPVTYGDTLETPFDNQPFDSLPWEIAENYSTTKDYIVINRSSRDRNPWSRNNLWFHINVINTTANANGQISLFDQTQRAIRPIIEFSPNLKLFNNGWFAKKDVDLVDTTTTDIFSIIEGSTKFYIDEEEIHPGYRILFLADTDITVVGRTFEVTKIFNANENKTQLSLQKVDDTDPVEGQVVYSTKGTINKGNSFYFQDGVWKKSQQKLSVNQSPLFDLFDESFNSFSDLTYYPYNNFSGNKVFSYQQGDGSTDNELGFPISYRSIDNIGDIVFSFDLQKQSWTYQENNTLKTLNSYIGFLRKVNDNDTFSYTNGWIQTYKNLQQSVVRILKITKETDLVPIDVYENSGSVSGISIRVYVDNKKIDPTTISFENIQGYYYIKFSSLLVVGSKVVYKVQANADKTVKGYYEIPYNWQNNPLNETVDTFTFGEVTDHVNSIIDNIITFKGNFPGISNLSNLGNISRYGQRFLQHAGSMPLAVFTLTDKHANIVKALRYTAQKYTIFKKEFIRLATSMAFSGTTAEIVDTILADYSAAKYLDLSAFYYSDMVASGAASVREYTVADTRLPVFVIDSIFTPMTTSKRLILVYRNDQQLLYGIDYEFDTTDAFVKITSTLRIGDKVTIKDYSSTDGRSYIPYTPSKLGLYPTYVPSIYIDYTYTTPTKVIQGHDGSIIVAYDDYRDELILELERRIFNSRKVEYDPLIFNIDDVLGGYYRKTDFSKDEVDNILLNDFLKWNSVADLTVSSNDYYVEENTFTYNYKSASSPNNTSLYGYWRGIYKHFYDTDRPHSHPWEMLGFAIKPTWWDTTYGEAPYTSENKIMWDNIEKGFIADPTRPRINRRYIRTGLSNHIPVDSDGNLLSPLDSNLVQNFSLVNAKQDYTFGDHAPVETAWRRSSEFPYSVIVAMCVLRGAEYIGKMWDRFTIKRNIAGQIYSTVSDLKIQPSKLSFPYVPLGNPNDPTIPVSVTSGLVNFIEEYLFDAKYTTTNFYKETLKALDAKLSYRISGFTSKDQINILLDSRSPTATGTVFLPIENYKIFYNKSSPIDSVSYSGVIIEKVGGAYPLWVSNHRYHSGERVIFSGEVYHCIKTHTSNHDEILTPSGQFVNDKDFWLKETIHKIGYKVRGYDNERNYFEIFGYRSSYNDPVINVGGISESYATWQSAKFYVKGQIIRLDNAGYYRAIIGHTSSSVFNTDTEKWAPLAKLPIVGGASAIRRTRFGTNPIKINYGTVFLTIQDVVDFLLGYQKRLEYWGFSFDDYNKELNVPLTWLTSAREFMFWTLQNWNSGAIISLSPAANKVKFIPQVTGSVDNTDTDFYDYSIFKADGSPLRPDLTDTFRDGAGFVINPSADTNDGIFHIRANLVYKEHILLFDNVSIFNDVLYDKVPGYRQGRLKIFGYKTSNWNGSYDSPGFLYDPAEINDWYPNTDYMIGDIVRYKSYYFTALRKVFGKSDFNYNDWKQLESAPTSGLIPNFDYRIEQFRDFYSLDANNFDSTQEALARHLIGYQPRQYLANIINDEVSQYKFYQGFIKEKGTLNSITKLFDVLRASGFSNIDIKEEWAFKIGEYGATDAYTEIEFELDEQKFLHNPQNINLTDNPTDFSDQSIYNIITNDITIKPSSYNSKPFKMAKIDPTQENYGVFKYQVAGYVKDEDVDHIIINESALLNYDITLFSERDKIWVGYTSNNDWNIYEFLNTNIIVTGWSASDNIISLECNVTPDVNIDDIIVISNLDSLDGSYKVQRVYNNIIEIFTFNSTVFTIQDNVTSGVIHTMKSARYSSLSDVSANRYNTKDIRGELIWVDADTTGKWLVLENKDSFTEAEIESLVKYRVANQEYGYEVKISSNNTRMFISSIKNGTGRIDIFTRSVDVGNWLFLQTLTLPRTYLGTISSTTPQTENFGYSIDVTDDGLNVVIGSPGATNLKTVSAYGINVGSEVGTPSGLTSQGMSVVFVYNPINIRYELDTVIASHDPLANEKFGSKVKIANDGINLWLFVSCIGYSSSTGRVQIFKKTNGYWRTDTSTQKYLNFVNTSRPYTPTVTTGNMYGYDIDCTAGAQKIAVSAPYKDAGIVYVFQRNDTTFNVIEVFDAHTMNTGIIPNTVNSNVYLNDFDYFGFSIAITDRSLFVSAPNNDNKGFNVGSVFLFSNITGSIPYQLEQFILPPIINSNDRFGTKLSINPSNNLLAVSAIGGDSIIPLTFDNYSDRVASEEITITGIAGTISSTNLITGLSDTSKLKLFTGMILTKTSGNGNFGGIVKIKTIDSSSQITIDSESDNTLGSIVFVATGTHYSYELDPTSTKIDGTTFDNEALSFYDRIPYTGTVYVYNRFDDKFIYGDRLRPSDDLDSDDKFGSSISVTDYTIAVGTPSRYIGDIRYGTVFTFDYTELSWSVKQSQDTLVDISKFKKAFIYNSKKNTLINALDFYDPAKGKIPSIADQEIKYQTYYDPAVYQYGVPSEVSVDESMPWTSEHVGELWWDLSKVKFTWYEQGDSTYRNNNWGRIFTGCTIDIYEWVETTYLPSKWAELADTEQGLASGISGIPKDIDNFTWSSKFKYDTISGTKTTLYYYWVKNKTVVPNIPSRQLSCADVSKLILDPKSQGYQYVFITNENTLSLSNIGNKLVDSDVSLNLQFYEVDNTELLNHREYVLIAKDDPAAMIPKSIENKWFDSLIGSNIRGQSLPDMKLNKKQRYGNLNSPRQSWFINRFEALKQLFEYTNSVLANNIIVDDINFSNLMKNDPIPSLNSGEIDSIVDVVYELNFVGTTKIKTAKMSVKVIDGKITNVFIDEKEPGFGYGRNKVYSEDSEGNPISWYGPNVDILGSGFGASIISVINAQGQIIEAHIIKSGIKYDTDTKISIRNHSVLVINDEEANNSWSVYTWSPTFKEWSRTKTQAFDVTRYWKYKDWYALGYGLSADINFQVERTVDLNGLPVKLGDIVKINNVGYSNWLLLERIDTTNSLDFTVDYRVVGKQNGTIEFSDKLYNLNKNVGFDTNFSFDLSYYDQSSATELRIILETLRDVILINNLKIEYIKIFFNSVYYVLSEQLYTDWCFKTSFLKVNHNVGTLKQRITFQSDEVDSYESYLEEAKPYKTKIREWVSSYQSIEDSNHVISDFDLPAYYNYESNIIEPTRLLSKNIDVYPWKNWLDNHTYQLIDIILTDGGKNYTTTPLVVISGDGTGAKASAYTANGSVYKIVIDNPGSGYTSNPSILISGGNGNNDETRAKAYARIGKGLVRTNLIGMKFDRYTQSYVVDDFKHTDFFTGTGNQTVFKLTFAPETEKNKFNILVDNIEYYGSQYSVSVIEKTHDTYTALEGYITFTQAPNSDSVIEITYDKNIKLYSAADRINYSYNPNAGQYGKDLSQLMTGIDYSGVTFTSIDFQIGGGWDVLSWDVTSWDNVLSSNDDYVVISDGITRIFTLPYTPELDEIINIYLNDVRIDDNDVLNSFVGNGINKIITIPNTIVLNEDDLITFRKSTSDGSLLPTDRSLIDSLVSGGGFSYSSASGINPEDIIIDGDGFVTTDSAHGPEELLQGNVFDTLNINVYHTPSSGGPNVYVNNYTGDGVIDQYAISEIPGTSNGIIVLVNNISVEFSIDFTNKTVSLNEIPAVDSKIVIIIFDTAGYDILDKEMFIGDGVTVEFLTAANYSKDNVTVFLTINGIETGAIIKSIRGKVLVVLDTPPDLNSVIQVMVFSGDIQKYSKVNNEYIPIVSNQLNYNLSIVPATEQPLSSNVFVEIDSQYLAAPDYKNYIYNSDDLTIIDPRYLPLTLSQGDINVYRKGSKLEPIQDFILDSAQNTVTLSEGVAVTGDEIIVEILKKNDFQIVNGILTLTGNFDIVNKHTIKITTFTNHDIFKVKRTSKGFTFATGYDLLGYDSNRYDLLTTAYNTSGIFDLPRTVSNTSGVFVMLNHKLLAPNVDFVVLDNRRQVKVILPDILIGHDYIEIWTTNDQTVHPSFNFKIFKDMMNRFSYKALENKKTTKLAQDFKVTDTSITLIDGSIITNVVNNQNTGTRVPGIIEINGERIEYFVKNGNVLSQLRRSTLGTTMNLFVPAGTNVHDIGPESTIPYTDIEIKKTAYGNGTNKVFEFDIVPEARYLKTDKNKTPVQFKYKETIPTGFYPCDQIEVYVAGRRLFKDPRTVYDQTKGQDSYKSAGDITVDAEFSVDGVSRSVRLTNAPNAGELVVIIAKRGKTWQKPNENLPLVYSTTDIARFLNTKQVDLPK